MDKKDKIILSIYFVFTILIVIFVSLGGINSEIVTRWLVVFFLLIQILLFPFFKYLTSRLSPKWKFVILATIFAMIVEGFHMISKPLDQSLLITIGMPFSQMMKYYLIDLIFTTPAYVIIFLVMWWFIKTYEYSFWQFVLVMGIGQALGDGSFFFLFNPGLLLLIPYVALNYNAMNIIPYTLVKDNLGKKRNSWKKYLALVVIPIVYIICGATIKAVAGLLHLW